MCKCCQHCFESCYWHCIEKWWCYDDNIALYEEPASQEKSQRNFDNLAFWDSVSVIANRSVVTIQPLPNNNNNNKIADIDSDKSNLVLEDRLDDQKATEKKLQDEKQTNTQTCCTEKRTNTEQINAEKDSNNVKNKDKVDSSILDKLKIRKKSAVEERIDKCSGTKAEAKLRKKSLKERRKSAAGLTLKLDNDFHEIPVIRQSSMPRFFLDTPEIDLHGNYGSERSSVLVSPVLGNSPTFDLKSIVQIEKELACQSKPTTPKPNRLNQVKKKFIPMMSKKPSSKSLPDSINHM